MITTFLYTLFGALVGNRVGQLVSNPKQFYVFDRADVGMIILIPAIIMIITLIS